MLWPSIRATFMCNLSPIRIATACRRCAAFTVAAGIWTCLLPGQIKVPDAPASASYQDEAVVVEQFETSFRYERDGTGEKIQSVRIKVTSDAGVRQYGVISLPYAD